MYISIYSSKLAINKSKQHVKFQAGKYLDVKERSCPSSRRVFFIITSPSTGDLLHRSVSEMTVIYTSTGFPSIDKGSSKVKEPNNRMLSNTSFWKKLSVKWEELRVSTLKFKNGEFIHDRSFSKPNIFRSLVYFSIIPFMNLADLSKVSLPFLYACSH